MNFEESINNKKIVLYGLGTETERILNEWNGKYEIIGLLDGFKTEGEQFGYPVMDIQDVVRQDDVIIIVVARPGSCKAIAKRIGDICRENEVELYDIRGKNLLQDTKVVYDFKSIRGYKKTEIIAKIQQADIISFDLFDTLVVRNIVTFSDVMELVKDRFLQQDIRIDDFVNKRIGAEKRLSKEGAPRLGKIYEDALPDISIRNITAEQLADIEYEVDVELLQPREDMLDLIHTIQGMNKKVYITSDSYYSQSQIEKILHDNGISGVDKIFVSCEYDTGKTTGLFEKVIEVAGTRNILHIGDDIVADVESAARSGLKTFQIYSATELLDAVGGLKLISDNDDISDHIRIGMFAANVFNSPFQFEDEERRIHVDDTVDTGYLFCAPMIFDFAYWFGQQVEEKQISNILFCARDGYLLHKIYSKIYPNSKPRYFLTSRTSAIRAGVSDDADIAYVDSMKFSGTLEDNLRTRFGIDADTVSDADINANESGLMRYSKIILETAKAKKANNEKYIERLALKDGLVALFDFVAKGTCQMYIQKLIPNEIQGLYFLQLEPEFMKDKNLKIQPFYSEEERTDSVVFDDYYILETLLTSPDPSVEEFNEEGEPVYANETRSDTNISCFLRAQEGIVKYIEKYLQICPRSKIKVNKKLDEAFLELIHNVEIRDNDFLHLTVEDPFFNRVTDIADLL